MSYRSEFPYLNALLGLGLIGQSFFSMSLLSRANNGIPDLARLATTENSASQMRYSKDGEKLDLTITHNMHQPKTVLFSSENSKWNGKTDYSRKEYIAHHPVDNAKLTSAYLQCIKDKGSAESQGEIVGGALISSTPASGFLSSLPVVGWLANSVAQRKASQIGKDIASDFVDC
jgi:hypothetical protein